MPQAAPALPTPHAFEADTVDLCGGPGGWDIPARRRGLKVTGIEKNRWACETRRAAGLGTVEGDVRDYGPRDFPRARRLIGSPPCQTFAINGKGEGRKALSAVLGYADQMAERRDVREGLATLSDERTGLVLEPLRWALEAIDLGRPYDVIMLEQVAPVLPVWEHVAEILRAGGYGVATARLSSEEYGVPQTRRRAVLTACLGGPAALPAPTHRAYRRGVAQGDGVPALLPWRSMADGCTWGMTHRPALTITVGTANGGADSSCVGGSGARKTLYGERDAGRWIADTRLTPADQLPVSRGGRPDVIWVHPRDAAALQSFSEDHPFQGPRTARLQQIGDAFPPLLADAVLRAAMTQELGEPGGELAA